jgi:hypothetical protein
MSLSNAPHPARPITIQRKAIGRKPVGSGPDTISRTPSVNEAESGISSVVSSGFGVATQQNALPEAPATHGVAQSEVVPPVSMQPLWDQNLAGGSGTPRRMSAVSSPSRSSTAASTQNGRSRGSIVYDNLAAVSAPQQPCHVNQVPGHPRPQLMERITPVKSFESILSSSPEASGWTTSPGSTSSYQSGYTTPLSKSSTGPIRTVYAGETTVLARSMSQSSSASSPPELPTCNQCRAVILPNLSIYDCLICSTGGISTKFCVYCFSKGVASAGHLQHDQSYYASKSDPAAEQEQEQKTTVGSAFVIPVPAHIWEVKKNAVGRIWYQHRVTGYSTHIRPYAAAVPAANLPVDWEVRSNPDGKKYYYHSSTGVSSWKRPSASSLPTGWREVRTPDSVSFYVHDALQLACWERPGQLPKTAADMQALATGTEKMSRSSRGKKSAGKPAAVHGVAAAGAAVTLASSITQLSDAADLSSQGIISATIAAAKLTSHGAKFAGKKMRLSKLANSRKLRMASKIFGHASNLASIGDEDRFDGGEDYEGSDDSGTECGDDSAQCGEETVIAETEHYQESFTATYQDSYEGYSPMEPIYEQPPVVPLAYEPGLETVQLLEVAEDPSNVQSEQPPIMVNNVYDTETVVCNEETTVEQANVENVYVTETVVCNEETTVEQANVEVNENVQNEIMVNENVQNDIQITENLQENMIVNDNTQLNGYSTVEEQTINNFQTTEVVAPIEPPLEIWVSPTAGLPSVAMPEYYPPPVYDPVITAQPPPSEDMPTGMLQGEVYPPMVPQAGPAQDDSVPPLVFNPVLAGPMMVNPPAEQNGVVFAPIYV